MDELLPCPFCGGEAGIARPGCKGSLSGAGCWGPGHVVYAVGETREEAIAAWNTRVTPPAPVEQDVERVARIICGPDADDHRQGKIKPKGYADFLSDGFENGDSFYFAWRGEMTKAHEIIASLSTLTPARAEGFKLPRLTDAMIRAACKGHYGDDNIDGICLTVHGTDYSFRDGFKRMWAAIRALKDAPDHG